MSIARVRPKTVYHYCSLETFFKIFSTSSIRLSNISKSNDAEEITYLFPEVKKYCIDLFDKYNRILGEEYRLEEDFVNKAFDAKINELSLNFYVACFSEEADLLSQWRGYANDACGVSIGFSTEMFFPLARSIRSSYNFSQVRYSVNDLYDQIERYSVKRIESQLREEARENSLLLLNEVDTIVSTILYNSILYKNPHFKEEKEWRLVFNPLWNIRRLMDRQTYYDRMSEHFHKSVERGGFIRNPMSFHIASDKIISHIDLSFEEIKNVFVNEIIIGSKAHIDDLDLELFLLSNGYDPRNIYIHRSNIPYR